MVILNSFVRLTFAVSSFYFLKANRCLWFTENMSLRENANSSVKSLEVHYQAPAAGDSFCSYSFRLSFLN